MIKFRKPKFWDSKKISFFSILLFPISLVTLFIIFLKRIFLREKSFKIPIICVGNIYIGGTSKTPTSIFIAKELLNLGIRPAILCKYYKDHIDEYKLIKNNFNDLILNKNREKGIIEAQEKKYDILILDDGLQDYKVKKDLKIVCFNNHQKFGNGLILPAGPLRESLNTLKYADIILLNGDRDLKFEETILEKNRKLEIYYSYYKPSNIHEFKSQKLLALAGIANPENFFMLLEKNNLELKKKLIFPDHYNFTRNEMISIIKMAEKERLKIIMTEKDYFKVNDYKLDKLNYLKVKLQIKNKEKLLERIKEFYD